jgi:hypothetical protein
MIGNGVKKVGECEQKISYLRINKPPAFECFNEHLYSDMLRSTTLAGSALIQCKMDAPTPIHVTCGLIDVSDSFWAKEQ